MQWEISAYLIWAWDYDLLKLQRVRGCCPGKVELVGPRECQGWRWTQKASSEG